MSNSFSFLATTSVSVSLKEEAFDDAFMNEFRAAFFNFNSLYDHAAHIAQMAVRGLVEPFSFGSSQFIEGYGRIDDFVSSISISGVELDPIIGDE